MLDTECQFEPKITGGGITAAKRDPREPLVDNAVLNLRSGTYS
jgi:hypothetical protein